jgi:hypothetical protein
VVGVCAPGGGAVVVGAELVTVELVDCGLVVDVAELVCEVVEVVAAPDRVVAAGVVVAPVGVVLEVVVAFAEAVETVPTGLA